MKENLLITGSSGYIGGYLTSALQSAERRVCGVDRVEKDASDLNRFTKGDLTNPGVCETALEGVEIVLHLAAAKGDWGISRAEYYRDNLEATRALIEAGKNAGVKNWVFYSTVSVMGPSHAPAGEEAAFDPINPYGASKAEAEKLFHQLAAEDPEARVLVVRPSVVYGPANPSSTNIYRLVDAIYRNRFVMVGPGEAIKSTSYIDNLIDATFFLMERMERGVQTYIYVDEPALTTGELVRRIYRLLGKTPPRWSLPLSLAAPLAKGADVLASVTGIDFPITAARIEKFNRSTNFDGSAIRELGFRQSVNNQEALSETVAWHLQSEYGAQMRHLH
jgi:nucleoside-diphosphate-sugar epimerase